MGTPSAYIPKAQCIWGYVFLLGFIVQDPQGSTILAVSLSKVNVHHPKATKSTIIFQDLQLCLHQEIPNLIIESDCLLVVEAIMSMGEPNSIHGNIWLDIRELMSYFACCRVQYGHGQDNMAAHKLIQYALNVIDIAMWYADMPILLKQAL